MAVTDSSPTTAPLGDHLTALRRMLFRIVLVVGGATIATFAGAPWILRGLLAPTRTLATDTGTIPFTLQTLAPAEGFKISITISLIAGAALTLPYLFAELWLFLAPGLVARERRLLRWVLGSGTLLFAVGAGFAYWAVVPLVMRFFWDYSRHLGITPGWTIGHYIDFVLGNMAAFGVAFELPLVIALLAALGIVSASGLRRTRRYAYFLICVLAAVLTPPDAVSMVLMALPLLVLYEASLWIAQRVERPRADAAAGNGTEITKKE